MKRLKHKPDATAQPHDAAVSAIEAFTLAPEAAKDKVVKDAQAALKQDAEDAVKILAEVRELLNAFAPERLRLEQIAWGRLILAGFSSQDCGSIERLLVELRDLRLEGLEDVPRRIENLTAEDVHLQIPAQIQWTVRVSRPLPAEVKGKIARVRMLVASVGQKVTARSASRRLADAVDIKDDDTSGRQADAVTAFDPYESGARA